MKRTVSILESSYRSAIRASLLSTAITVAVFSTFPAAQAQSDLSQPAKTDNGGALEEIVVTAQKRSEVIKDIPMSVDAFSAVSLERAQISSFDDYATQVPNLSFAYSGAGREIARTFQIRGITGNDTSALYLGETPVPISINPRVVDLDRIEVLRGPQGTLFGARSMGGLIREIPADPNPSSTYINAHASGADVNHGGADYAADFTLNLPVTDNVAVRLTPYIIHDAGFIDRLVNPTGSLLIQKKKNAATFPGPGDYTQSDINDGITYGISSSAIVTVNDWLTITPRFLFQKTESNGPDYVDNSLQNLVKIRQFDLTETGRDDWKLGAVEAKADVGLGQIVSSTSYFKRNTFDIEDSGYFIAAGFGSRITAELASPAISPLTSSDERVTQEVRFVSDFSGPFKVISGLFFQHKETASAYLPTIIPHGSPLTSQVPGIFAGDNFYSSSARSIQDEVGLFGEVNYKILEDVTLTFGGRYFNIDTSQSRFDDGDLITNRFLGGLKPTPFSGTENDTGFDPRFAATWQPSEQLTVYANIAKGFRPGFANTAKSACLALGDKNIKDSVASDSLWNYETGVKTELLDRRLTVNTSLYYIVWSNRQTNVTPSNSVCGGLGFGYSDNVGEAISKGGEFEVNAKITRDVTFSFGSGYTDAEITDTGGAPNVRIGQPLANVPRWTAVGSVEYDTDLTPTIGGFAHADYKYTGSSIDALNKHRPSYHLVDLRAGVAIDDWQLALYIKNVFDTRADLSDVDAISDNTILHLIDVSRPRTIGVDLRAKF